MNVLALTPPLQAAVPDLTTLAVVLVLLSGGLVGMSIRNMFDSIISEDEDEKSEDGGLDGFGDEFASGPADGGDGLDGLDDDLGGLGGLDDDVGGFGDDLDGAGEKSAGVGELEHRIDEFENELGSLSSTVNTVRTENEQIAESVGEVEENVRKLLDIYEMVTRGVNPFADDIDAGLGGGDLSDGSFGLFDDEEPTGGDDELSDADAEGFFDEELIDDSFDEDLIDDSFDDFGDEADAEGFQDGFDDESGGASFEELKAEYESGDADWADSDDEGWEDETDGDQLFDEAADAEGEWDDGLAEESTLDEAGGDDTDESADAGESVGGEEFRENGDGQEADERIAAGERADTEDDAGGVNTEDGAADTSTATDTKPYLSTVPEGFAAELLVVEWLEFLVEEGGVRESARALEYYERIDWLDERVADELQAYLRGFDGDGDGSLTIEHHTQSLRYIGQLSGDGAAVALLCEGGGADGIQC